jgi:2-C-methyl-D-erythritol 4-phosphate cytidylyltransferase
LPNNKHLSLIAIVPAAGIGKRMLASCPKQYLTIDGKTVLEHTIERLLSHDNISKVILVLGEHDEYFQQNVTLTHLVKKGVIETVIGGKERVDSVLSGLNSVNTEQKQWVLVHDAARPCVSHIDIDKLIRHCQENETGALLAAPVRDTMKRSSDNHQVKSTVDRELLWHALTPQMYLHSELKTAIESGLKNKVDLTDESSAIEAFGLISTLIEGSSDNIKITRPDDLALASFILSQQKLVL